MPTLNLEIDDELMRQIRIRAASENKTRRALVIETLKQAVDPASDAQSLQPCEAEAR